jgi:tetratricopeptide (TPR) repeat protein
MFKNRSGKCHHSFRIRKNHLALKDYKKAYSSFERATQIDPTNKWFWVGMYDVDYETKDYGNAIKRLKINPFDSKFRRPDFALHEHKPI